MPVFIKVWILLNMLLFSVALAHAQEPVAQTLQAATPPRERALMERVGAEINNNLVCSTNVAALQDRIKELESKLKAAPTDQPKE